MVEARAKRNMTPGDSVARVGHVGTHHSPSMRECEAGPPWVWDQLELEWDPILKGASEKTTFYNEIILKTTFYKEITLKVFRLKESRFREAEKHFKNAKETKHIYVCSAFSCFHVNSAVKMLRIPGTHMTAVREHHAHRVIQVSGDSLWLAAVSDWGKGCVDGPRVGWVAYKQESDGTGKFRVRAGH